MKYIPIPEMDLVSNALNFSTPVFHVIGGCEIYATKASKNDRKLYKKIDTNLESQYGSLVKLSASLSPPALPINKNGEIDVKDNRKGRERTVDDLGIDLSRTSPFGPLSQPASRRTFAYMIATLNATHDDYEFSNALHPHDFRKERSMRTMMHDIDSTMQSLRPVQTAKVNALPPLQLSRPGAAGLAKEVWNPVMWKMIDEEMTFRSCERYKIQRAQDVFEGEEGALWSMHYFLYNKERKRVCYIHLRTYSVMAFSPVNEPTVSRPKKIYSSKDGAQKRASYWLGSGVNDRNVYSASYGDDEENYDEDDEIEVPFMSLDDVRNDLMNGRIPYDDGVDDDDPWKYGSYLGNTDDIFEQLQMEMEMEMEAS